MKIEDKIKKVIKKSDNIFVSGHRNLDLDAIGACIGIESIARHYEKECFIIIDDKEHELGVEKIIFETKDKIKYINSSEIADLYKNNSILIIVDTNKAQLLQNDKILHHFNTIIILDHHQETEQTISNTLKIIDETKSSACELITDLIKQYKVKLNEVEATIVLSGIVLDTKNFTTKTKTNTYSSAYFLSKYKADSKKVQYYLKEDIKDYIIRNKVIMNVEVVNGKYAVALGDKNTKYKREELAKIADKLLNFNGIEASFVIGNRENKGIGLSARSEGLIDVGMIAETLGGGGDIYNAASHLTDITLKEFKNELLKIINKEE